MALINVVTGKLCLNYNFNYLHLGLHYSYIIPVIALSGPRPANRTVAINDSNGGSGRVEQCRSSPQPRHIERRGGRDSSDREGQGSHRVPLWTDGYSYLEKRDSWGLAGAAS